MRRRLGILDAVLIVMGGILGSGIFLNPALVAGYLHSVSGSYAVWIAGGAIALLGAGLFAELGARRPVDGGLYAYVRDAFHPSIAFVYGWTLLLVAQSGGMAAGAVTFALYVVPALGLHVSASLVAAVVIAVFTAVNCLGVRFGAIAQHAFMLLNAAMIAAIAVLAFLHPASPAAQTPMPPVHLLAGIGLALVAVLFAYDGWHTGSFASIEFRRPERALPLGVTVGTIVVVGLYLLANWAFVRALGLPALAASQTPATDVARAALGATGAALVTTLVAIATISTLTQQILVAPRIYYQMAVDGTFFGWLARINPRTDVPIFAVAAQGTTAAIVALSGSYAQILNYVESVDFVFFALAAIALFVFRRRDKNRRVPFMLPLHPYSTGLFLAVSVAVVADIAITSPRDTLIGLGIMAAGLPAYWLFRRYRRASRVA